MNTRGLRPASRASSPSPRNRPPGPASRSRSMTGGLGFGFKWNMGCMHDTLDYMAREPVHRKLPPRRHDLRPALRLHREFRAAAVAMTRWCTAKARCSRKMPGDDWQKFATLRAYYAFMWGYPGKKLLFMGQEFAPAARMERGARPRLAPARLRRASRACRQLVARPQPALPRRVRRCMPRDCEREGFAWLIADDRENSVFAWLRSGAGRAAGRGRSPTSRRCRATATACRCRRPGAGARSSTPTPRIYGGSGMGNVGAVEAEARRHGRHRRATLTSAAAGDDHARIRPE